MGILTSHSVQAKKTSGGDWEMCITLREEMHIPHPNQWSMFWKSTILWQIKGLWGTANISHQIQNTRVIQWKPVSISAALPSLTCRSFHVSLNSWGCSMRSQRLLVTFPHKLLLLVISQLLSITLGCSQQPKRQTVIKSIKHNKVKRQQVQWTEDSHILSKQV